ncbi:MAG: XdhC/CoxI family protein [Candidatus Bathyarchaeia archaeon]
MKTDLDIIKQIERILEKGLRLALCILVDKRGSGPREPGAKMLVVEDGQTFGTIGGGSFERALVKEALRTIEDGKPRKVIFSLTEEGGEKAIKTGLICGGEVEVFIDIMEPKLKLVIIGAGHVAEPLTIFATHLGFDVIVVDDNEKLASKERFPMAKEIITGKYKEILDRINVSQRDFVVIVYGEPEHDYLALEKMVRKKPFYIGLMGSKTKVNKLLERLKKEGVSDEELKSLHAPVGLDIGAQTPEEIAISILAEIIAEKRGAKKENVSFLKDQFKG